MICTYNQIPIESADVHKAVITTLSLWAFRNKSFIIFFLLNVLSILESIFAFMRFLKMVNSFYLHSFPLHAFCCCVLYFNSLPWLLYWQAAFSNLAFIQLYTQFFFIPSTLFFVRIYLRALFILTALPPCNFIVDYIDTSKNKRTGFNFL